MRTPITAAIATIALVWVIPTAAVGSGSGAIIMSINTDAATEGMGGAGGAAWWGVAPEASRNPALLGFHRGVGYHSDHQQLAVGLADGVFLDSTRLTIGYAGIGVHVQAGAVETYLDMGEQSAIDEQGNLIGRFQSFQRSRGLGLGFSLGSFLDATSEDGSALDVLGRHLDVAGGAMRKDFAQRLASDGVLQDRRGGEAEAVMADYGVLGRLTIYDSLGGPGLLPALDRALYPLMSGWTLSAAYGRSWLNWGDDFIVASDEDRAHPYPRESCESWAIQAAIGLPGLMVDGLPPVVRTVASPALSVAVVNEERWPGYLWNGDAQEYEYAENRNDPFIEKNDGVEVTFLGIYSRRWGHTEVPYGDIDGDTSGWGLRFDIDGMIRLRYDKATRPQATGLSDVSLESWSVIVDVLALRDHLND